MKSEFQIAQAKIDRDSKTDWPLVVITFIAVVPCMWLVVKHLG